MWTTSYLSVLMAILVSRRKFSLRIRTFLSWLDLHFIDFWVAPITGSRAGGMGSPPVTLLHVCNCTFYKIRYAAALDRLASTIFLILSKYYVLVFSSLHNTHRWHEPNFTAWYAELWLLWQHMPQNTELVVDIHCISHYTFRLHHQHNFMQGK